MIQSHIGHIVIHVESQNLPFYKDLLTFMGWKVWYEDPNMLGVGDERNESLWFGQKLKDHVNDYDGPGMNHLGIEVNSVADVDAVAAYLGQHDVPALFETPRHRPDFQPDPSKTYYQVMFESPDRVLFEVVYIGPLSV